MVQMDEKEAREFFAEMFYGEHHIPDLLKPQGFGWGVTMTNDFSTFDFNLMTRFVIACHDKCYRGSVRPGKMGTMVLGIWKRTTREGSTTERHPTIEQAIESHRNK